MATRVTKRTYADLCKTCKGKGFIGNPNFNPYVTSSVTTIPCPVCGGSKIITVTETIEEYGLSNNQ